MRKFDLMLCLIIVILTPAMGIGGPLSPCTVVAYVNGNTYIQSPTYSVDIDFTNGDAVFTSCNDATTVTIIVSNPPQNPQPTAPVYMSLINATGGTYTSQVLLPQGTTVITSAASSDWFSITGNRSQFFRGVYCQSVNTVGPFFHYGNMAVTEFMKHN